MRLRGVGGVRAVRAGMGWERWERNSEGMGGVRVFSGGVNDGRGGRRWDLVIGEWVIMSFFGGDNNNFLPKRRTFGIIHIFGKV